MELHAKNGELRVNPYGVFLPTIDNSEYKVAEDAFTMEVIESKGDDIANFLPEGQYQKVTALVEVTRYYKLGE